ncbi:MAG: methyltransferase domain-containing protein [Acidimicrobiales bacterium]
MSGREPTTASVRRVARKALSVSRDLADPSSPTRRRLHLGCNTPYWKLGDNDLVRMAYTMLLRREPDDHGRTELTSLLAHHAIGPFDVVDRIRASDEFHATAPLGPANLGHSLHASRRQFILGLPPARRIVDLGGSHTNHQWGAFVAMGYPYDFDELVVVDLPSGERHPVYRSSEYEDVSTPRGPVRYRFQSMTDLSFADTGTVDLVYSGQSIEHVTPADANAVLGEVRRVLRPGGYLALDTPNSAVCRLQQEDFIDPDHEFEYSLSELTAKVSEAGFEVCDTRGLNYAGHSVARGIFDQAEVAANTGVFFDAAKCYLLALLCRAPR